MKDIGGAAAPPAFERILLRDHLITLAALAAAAGLAWLWLLSQAGAEMDMTAMQVAPWSVGYLLTAFTMWLLMMVAMMLPSATPMILFYARFARRSAMRGGAAATALFASAYVAIWAVFALFAAALQALLVSAGTVSAMALAVGDRRVAGVVLLLAGIYQLTPLKRACLRTCRSPLDFLMRLWRPGIAGAVGLGLAHGLYCLGCCWALMLLLFVGGVMNLAWIALLAFIVMAEKFVPNGQKLSRWLGTGLVLSGLCLVAWPA